MKNLPTSKTHYPYGTKEFDLQTYFQECRVKGVEPSYESFAIGSGKEISDYQYQLFKDTHNKWGMPYNSSENGSMQEVYPTLLEAHNKSMQQKAPTYSLQQQVVNPSTTLVGSYRQEQTYKPTSSSISNFGVQESPIMKSVNNFFNSKPSRPTTTPAAVEQPVQTPNAIPYRGYVSEEKPSVYEQLTKKQGSDAYFNSSTSTNFKNFPYLVPKRDAKVDVVDSAAQKEHLASFRNKRPISLNDPSKFVGYGYIIEETKDTIKDCLALSKIILHNHDVDEYGEKSNVFKLMEELWVGEGRTDNDRVLRNYDDGITSIAQNYRNAINCIDEHLEADRPIIVGVSHSKPRRKKSKEELPPPDLANEGATDHFIVVNGRGFDEKSGLPYYTYYEVGTSTSFGYNMEENRLVYDPINLTFYDLKSKSDKRYDVTQVRPNNKNLEGTISQGERK